jgi:hypothetical protein
MKKQDLTGIPITLLLVMLFFAACGQSQAPANNTGGQTSTASPAAQQTSTPAPARAASAYDLSSPTKTFTSFYEAAKKKDATGIRSVLSKDDLAEMERIAKEQKTTMDDSFKPFYQDVPAQLNEMRNEQINGEKATLEIKESERGAWETINFVKEDGQWKITMK